MTRVKKSTDVVNIFGVSETAELRARFESVGEGGRLKVRITKMGQVLLSVVPNEPYAEGDEPPEINNSHRCPPATDCP